MFREVSINDIKAGVLQYRCLVNFEDIAMRRYNQERSSNEPRSKVFMRMNKVAHNCAT